MLLNGVVWLFLVRLHLSASAGVAISISMLSLVIISSITCDILYLLYTYHPSLNKFNLRCFVHRVKLPRMNPARLPPPPPTSPFSPLPLYTLCGKMQRSRLSLPLVGLPLSAALLCECFTKHSTVVVTMTIVSSGSNGNSNISNTQQQQQWQL